MTLKPGDRIRLEGTVTDIALKEFSRVQFDGATTTDLLDPGALAHATILERPLAVGDWVKTPDDWTGKILCIDDGRAWLRGTDNCRWESSISRLTRVDPPASAATPHR